MWNYHQPSNPKWIGKWKGSIKSWSNICNAQPIIIKIIGPRPLVHGGICVCTTYSAFINTTNPFICKSCFPPQVWHPRCAQHRDSHVVGKHLSTTCIQPWGYTKTVQGNANVHHKDQPNFKVKNQVLLQQHIKTTWHLEKLDY
jgi:hypothetical protein